METAFLPRALLARQHFGNDAPWFEQRIPFFSCSDPKITQIYYYRWKLFKSHLKDLGERGNIVTEFLDDVSWSLKPYESLNDATGFHIGEGRWLRDRQPIDDYINFMYSGGNDRHFSEAIADASYRRYLVDGDRAFIARHLPEMKRIFGLWNDRYDAARGLYFIEPLLDATEYTISSIDASGGKDGFRGGDSFRPSINSFMFANARAISFLAAEQGDLQTAAEYAQKAAFLRDSVQKNLWNAEMEHFIDRYKVQNQFVKNWDFIRGRELAGYTPWYFDLPDQNPRYSASWKHLLSPTELGGPRGIRTVEPSYQYYMKQYRYEKVAGVNFPECQWNGPSWPFQTTLALGGMANLLNNYRQSEVNRADYGRLFRQYTEQHYLNGEPNLQEDYNPDTGQVIVGLARSNHYFHSGYIDLLINGLVGIRPRADNILEVNPLIATDPNDAGAPGYFCLENVLYHGHNVSVLYDRDGKHFGKGAGLSVFVDGKQKVAPSPLGRRTVTLSPLALPKLTVLPPARNQAINLARKGFPVPSASASDKADAAYQAIDGRVWFYPEVRNFWSNRGSAAASDWFSLDFGGEKSLHEAQLFFYGDQTQFKAPLDYGLQFWQDEKWDGVPNQRKFPAIPLANGENRVSFPELKISRLRVVFSNPRPASVALVEFKAVGANAAPVPSAMKSANLAELLAASNRNAVDIYLPGEALSSPTQGFAGKNSRTGSFGGGTWRDAQDGGFFAFDLKVASEEPNHLEVTYWGGETGQRDFEILVNGQKIAAQTLQNNHPGEFFNLSYPIPRSLTRNTKQVTVRFQARPGATAGGIFGARVLRR